MAGTNNVSPALDGVERVLVVSDLHGYRPHLDWLRINARDYDLVLIPGDFDDASSEVPPDARAAITSGFVAEIAARTPVALCSGNHDLDAVDEHGERVAHWARSLGPNAYGDGQLVECGDIAISLMPWWDGPTGAAALRQQMAEHAAVAAGKRWVWAHHAPIADSPTSWDGTCYRGDDLLAELVAEYAPEVVVSGHIHDAPFLPDGYWCDRRAGSLLLNAGHQRTMTPSFIELDLAADRVTWHGDVGGARVVDSVEMVQPSPSGSKLSIAA